MTTKTQQSQRFSFNAEHPGLVRDEVRDGTMFLVVPVVMLREQILFCSNCHPDGEFISANEIMSTLVAWDNRPVTLSHPNQEWTPANHQRLEVGRVFNTFWDGKLKAEMWLDLAALKSTMQGREAEQRFRDGKVTEVSTGYFVDRVTGKGKFQGTTFAIRQVGLVPDHLAILTDEVGACSVAGGCGAPRLNSTGGNSMDDETKLLARIADFFLGRKNGEQSTDDQTAENTDGGDASDSATGDDGGSGEEGPDGSESSMDETAKKDLVRRLLASKKVETFDEKALLAMTDEQLTALETLTGCGCNDGGDDGDGNTADNAGGDGGSGDDGDGGGDSGDGDGNTATFSEEDVKFVAALRAASGGTVEGLTALMEAGKAEAERREALKDDLVAQLHKDPEVAITEAVLNSMALEALEGLDRSLNPMSYAGQGGPKIENRGGVDDIFAPDAPSIILASKDDDDDKGGDS